MGYNDCRHGAEMCDQCLDILSDGINQGTEQERTRILELLDEQLGGHLRVCNYEAVTDEPCDVCAWAEDTLALIKGENNAE